MPDEQQNLDELKKFVNQVRQSPEKELNNEEIILFYMRTTLDKLKRGKSDDRSESARRYAIVITEMEKVFSYFYTYMIVGAIDTND